MQKFLSIPVTDQQNQLVAVSNVVLVEQLSTTAVTISYDGGQVVTLTHTALGAGVETMRDAIQDAIEDALQTRWTQPVYRVDGVSGRVNLPAAVSGIASAFDAASFSDQTFLSLTADYTLTKEESGATIFLDATGEDVTLPASTSAWEFKFVCTDAVATTPWQILSAEGDNINGSIVVNGAAVVAADEDQINFVESAALAGDYIVVTSHPGGAGVQVTGIGQATGAITATDPS